MKLSMTVFFPYLFNFRPSRTSLETQQTQGFQGLSSKLLNFIAWSAARSKHSPQNMLGANAVMPKRAVYKRLFVKGSEQTQLYHLALPAYTRKIHLKRQTSYKLCVIQNNLTLFQWKYKNILYRIYGNPTSHHYHYIFLFSGRMT